MIDINKFLKNGQRFTVSGKEYTRVDVLKLRHTLAIVGETGDGVITLLNADDYVKGLLEDGKKAAKVRESKAKPAIVDNTVDDS